MRLSAPHVRAGSLANAMSSLTPTPTPAPRPDEVTQPNASAGTADDPRRGLARSPAQWEVEALAMVEEADARAGVAAGALRYAAARMLEDGVGDLAAAMDHLQLALDEPPAATFRPILRALRIHAIETGSVWSAIDLLDIEISAATTVGARADLAVEKAELLEHRLLARARARVVLDGALALVPDHHGALLALEATALRAGDAAEAALLEKVLEKRLRAAATAPERACLLCRLALLAEADPQRTAEALALWVRVLGEGGGRGTAALARAGVRRVAAQLGNDGELARAVGLEAEVAEGPARAAWLALGAALARHRLGATARAAAMLEEARAADPDDPALLMAAASVQLAAGQWRAARTALDRHAELSQDRDWAATLAGLSAHVAEHLESDDEAAAARYRRLLETRPGDPVGQSALERIASRTGDAAAQVALAELAVDHSAEGAERAALAVRAAEVAETAAHDLPRAAALARRALEAVPGYAPAAHLLERLYPALGRWDELVKVVEAEGVAGARAGDEVAVEAASRLERLGALYEDPLRDPGKALALYGEWAALGTRRVPALRALLRAAEKAGDALVAAEAALKLGTEIRELPTETRFAWCYRAATIYEERAAADDEAVRAYEAALALMPTSRPALAGLARAHYRGGQHEALVAVLSRQAAAEANPANASALEVEAARILAFRLGRVDEALAATARALTWDPSNVAAIAEHARLLGRGTRGEDLAVALGNLGQALSDPADKVALYRLQAETLEWQLGRRREALVAIDRALSAAGAGQVAGLGAAEIARERLHLLAGRGAELASEQLQRLGDATAPGARTDAALGRRLDLAWRLADPEAAWRALRGALELTPADPAGAGRGARARHSARARARGGAGDGAPGRGERRSEGGGGPLARGRRGADPW